MLNFINLTGYKNIYLPKMSLSTVRAIIKKLKIPGALINLFFPSTHTEEVRDGSILGSLNLQLDATSMPTNYLEDESVEGLFFQLITTISAWSLLDTSGTRFYGQI